MKIELENTAKRLVLIRGLRSLGQGAMVVDLTLYLKDLHWSGTAIGGVTSAAGLFGAALILMVGILSDRLGRKPFLVIYEILTMLAAVAASLSTQALILVLAVVVAGFGRGQSGAAGPFSPAEQAWLARLIKPSQRGLIFSLNNAVGFIGMAVGALIGGLPGLFPGRDPLTAYRPVFLLVAAISLVCFFILLSLKEADDDAPPQTAGWAATAQDKVRSEPVKPIMTESGSREKRQAEEVIRREENVSMVKLAMVNALNGLAIGLTGPMMAYWFSIRYGVGSTAIGLTLAAGYLLTGISSVLNGFLAQKVGVVKSVTWMRVVGSVLMLTLPLMPNFTFASVIFVLRNAINRGTTGNRFALGASLTRDRRRGFATSINALSMRLPSSIGPSITGSLFDMGLTSLPLYLTAGLQLVNAIIYQKVFGRYDQAAK